MFIRFCAVVGCLIALETAVFVYAYDDLLELRREPAALVAQDTAKVRELTQTAIARRHLTDQHLQTLADVAGRRAFVDIEVRSLERLHRRKRDDVAVALQLADAYRRAQRYPEATALYEAVIGATGADR